MNLFRLSFAVLALQAASLPAQFAPARQPAATAFGESTGVPYATLARLALDAPIVADVTIRSAVRIAATEAPGLAQNQARFYVTADVGALVRGNGALSSRIGYLADVALDARGRAPSLKRQRLLIFARPVAGRPDQLQLITPAAQFEWGPLLDQRVRAVVTEVIDPAAPPAITGIGNAFHVPGSLPGEGETQIFLKTATGDPVSVLILRRPGEERRWALALGDIIDEARGAPQRDTLAWYRLACTLPAELPEASVGGQAADAAMIAREDYRFVRAQLGRCDDGRVGQES